MRILALALWAVAQASSLVHMAAVRHERCAEHGELVEVTGPARQLGEMPHHVYAASGAERDHEHCPLTTSPGAPATAHAQVHAGTVVAPRADAPRAFVRIALVDALVDAPKHGPPSMNV